MEKDIELIKHIEELKLLYSITFKLLKKSMLENKFLKMENEKLKNQ